MEVEKQKRLEEERKKSEAEARRQRERFVKKYRVIYHSNACNFLCFCMFREQKERERLQKLEQEREKKQKEEDERRKKEELKRKKLEQERIEKEKLEKAAKIKVYLNLAYTYGAKVISISLRVCTLLILTNNLLCILLSFYHPFSSQLSSSSFPI